MQEISFQINKGKRKGKEETMISKVKEKFKEIFRGIVKYNTFKGVRKRNYPLVLLGGTLSAFSYLYQFDIIIFDVITTKTRLPLSSYLICVALTAMGMAGFCMMHKGLTEYWI